MTDTPIAIKALETPVRAVRSIYPEPFAAMMDKREKRVLGSLLGLNNFGVNLTRILPSGRSALRHAHSRQDEFVYILEGTPTLITDAGETPLEAGMCAGFPAGTGDAHMLVNSSDKDVLYLEVGDRSAGDIVAYPDDDLTAAFTPNGWRFSHKDGTPY